MQLFDTPGKDDLHKVNCFFGFGKGFDLSLCYGTTNIHHLLYAQASLCSKNPNTNNVTIEKASMQGKEAAQLFISWTRSRWCTWSSSESSKQISAHVYPCLENDSLVFFLFYGCPTTHRFLCRLFPPSAFLTTPFKSIRRLFSLFRFPRRFSLPGLFPHYRLPFPCWSATVSLPPSWSKLPEPSANHKTQNSPMREIGLRTGVHTHVLVHCHNWNILSYGLKMWYRNVSNWC